MIEKLTEQLRRDEGESLVAYQDHLGYWTIGVGRLIDHRKGGGITRDESAMLLANDIQHILTLLPKRIPFFHKLDDARKGALCNMAFQMGVGGLMSFATTLDHLSRGEFEKAADAMLFSKWAHQTPQRAARISNQIRTGEWQ